MLNKECRIDFANPRANIRVLEYARDHLGSVIAMTPHGVLIVGRVVEVDVEVGFIVLMCAVDRGDC